MKRMILCLAVVCLLAACNDNDVASDSVPDVVKKAVTDKYPDQKIDWKKTGEMFEAEIDVNDSTDITLQLDASGKVIMQKEDVPVSEVPASIHDDVKQQYDGEIDDAERLEKNGQVYYQVELKGMKDRKLVYNQEGRADSTQKYWE